MDFDDLLSILQDLVDKGFASDIEEALDYCLIKTWNGCQPIPQESQEEINEIRRRVAAMRRGEERVAISSREQFKSRILAASNSMVSKEEAAILNSRLDALDRGEGIPFENGEDLMGRIMERVRARRS